MKLKIEVNYKDQNFNYPKNNLINLILFKYYYYIYVGEALSICSAMPSLTSHHIRLMYIKCEGAS